MDRIDTKSNKTFICLYSVSDLVVDFICDAFSWAPGILPCCEDNLPTWCDHLEKRFSYKEGKFLISPTLLLKTSTKLILQPGNISTM